ncbi:hypothetical protein [Methylobacterium sp. AMS5]|uniref:hypothetical protein n=1 Tax=Methylobacterium sp. AMS5 TaxID=925818 RepID=UPI00074F90C0|nr:hypothetical protein [Methylobacterium sp. AMS5]AMB46905.1 hypothetical protein Y590_18370 [Methylobacterium sp. AMS5]
MAFVKVRALVMTVTSLDFCQKIPSDFLSLERAVTRNAGAVIKDPFAILVLRFIADRTFGWSKTAEFISAAQFLNGIVSKGGELICAGLPLGKTKLYDSLSILKQAGALTVETIRGRVQYSIPLEFAMQLKMSKAAKARLAQTEEDDRPDLGDDFAVEQAAPVVRIADSSPVKQGKAVRHADTKERTSSFRTITEERSGEAVASLCAVEDPIASSEQSKLGAAIASVKDKAAALIAKRAARAAEHNGLALFEGFAAAAQEAWVEASPLPAPTGKQIGRLRNHSKAWNHEGVTFLGFLEWCAANWRGVWASKMSHVPDPKIAELFSEYPSVESILIFHKAFRDSYDRRDTQRIRAGLTRRDNLIRQYAYRGFSLADAEREADEVLAREKVREDLNADRLKHNEAVRRLEAKEQDLDTRIALGKARLAMQPVSLARQPLKVVVTHDLDKLPSLPEWKDEEEAFA